ncbi:MAG: HD domain-containing protein [Deferrisomatales bacterium]|nr:HD domain-containing protein [Deferrisomatales bacterium]
MSEPVSRTVAERLLQALVGLVKVQALYPEGHGAEARARKTLAEVLHQVLGGGESLLLGCRDGYLVVGDVPFIGDGGSAAEVVAWLDARGAEGVTLRPGVRAEEVAAFCRWLRNAGPDPWQGERLVLTRLARGKEEWQKGLKAYRKALDAVQEVYEDLAEGRHPDPTRGRESVREFSALLQESPEVIQGLSLIKDYDRYTYHHSVNVCLLALRVGQQWRLSAHELETLGMGGLFHDIGKTRTPAAVVRKAGPLTAQEWAAMCRHPEQGRELVEEMALLPPDSTLLVYEHHMHHNGGGYPGRAPGYRVHPLSSVISVSDVCDAMTSHRSYNRPLSLPGAMQQLEQLRGKTLDPAAVDMLLAVLGPVPLGAVVRLPSGELGVVVAVSGEDEAVAVRVVRTTTGEELDPATGPVLHLGSGRDLHPVDPLAHRISPVEVLQHGS